MVNRHKNVSEVVDTPLAAPAEPDLPPSRVQGVSNQAGLDLGVYNKAVVAALGAVMAALSDAVFDVSDGITVAIVVLTALGVYRAPNKIQS